MDIQNNKRTYLKAAGGLLLLAALILVFFSIYHMFSQKAQEGEKQITIEVVNDEGASKRYEVDTDAGYLREVLESTDGLTVEGAESDYGLMVDTVNGLTADFNTNGAYWAFYVDGEYCNYGVDEQPVLDGQAYRIVYTAE